MSPDRVARLQAIARLPLMLQETYQRSFPFDSPIGTGIKGKSSFNPAAVAGMGGVKGAKKIVVITNETPARTAAMMARGPLGNTEKITTGKAIWQIASGDTTKSITDKPINGEYYTVTYNGTSQNTFTITRKLREGETGEASKITIRADLDKTPAQAEVRPQLEAFFKKKFKVHTSKSEGLVFEAEKPELCGIPVVIHHADDQDLLGDIDKNTIVVVLGRSTNRREHNGEGVAIADPVTGRTGEELGRLRANAAENNDLFRALDSLRSGHRSLR